MYTFLSPLSGFDQIAFLPLVTKAIHNTTTIVLVVSNSWRNPQSFIDYEILNVIITKTWKTCYAANKSPITCNLALKYITPGVLASNTF